MIGHLQSYRLLATWQLEAVLGPILVMIPIQFMLSGALAIGLGYLVPELDATAAQYLSTGAPTIAVLTVGLVVLPQQLAQEKITGGAEFHRTVPAPAVVRMAAVLTPHIVTTLPGALLALFVAAAHFDFDISPSPLALVALAFVALGGAAIGIALAAVSPHPMLTSVLTNVFLFFVMLFSPVNFPIERLPDALQSVHEVLPVEPMAVLVRSTLTGVATETSDWVRVAVWSVTAFVISTALSARRS